MKLKKEKIVNKSKKDKSHLMLDFKTRDLGHEPKTNPIKSKL